MKKTGWYPTTVKPVNSGVYETRMGLSGRAFQYWNGRRWGLGSFTPKSAFAHKEIESAFQDVTWRGLAQKPE